MYLDAYMKTKCLLLINFNLHEIVITRFADSFHAKYKFRTKKTFFVDLMMGRLISNLSLKFTSLHRKNSFVQSIILKVK